MIPSPKQSGADAAGEIDSTNRRHDLQENRIDLAIGEEEVFLEEVVIVVQAR